MSLSGWEIGVVIGGVVLETALIVLLLRKHYFRSLPSFVLYLGLNIIEDPTALILQRFSSHLYTQYYFVITVMDYLLQLLVLWEIARNALRPSSRSLPVKLRPLALILVSVCVVATLGVMGIGNLSLGMGAHTVAAIEQALVRISLVLAVLKILLFLCLAGFAQVLGISWKDHVLQLASGFAFFAAVSVYIQYANDHVAHGPSYLIRIAVLNDIQAAVYLLTLAFWIWAFSRNDAPRKEFTPQMQEVLVTIAQSAKRTRLAVTRSTERR